MHAVPQYLGLNTHGFLCCSDSFRFGAYYYAVSTNDAGRSEQPNSAFPLGYDRSELNDLPQPEVCPTCRYGPNCENFLINNCACNPCENFDDTCISSTNPAEARTCESNQDSTGNPFTLIFMQNRPDDTPKRELVRKLAYYM